MFLVFTFRTKRGSGNVKKFEKRLHEGDRFVIEENRKIKKIIHCHEED
jgi:hypothetical protein